MYQVLSIAIRYISAFRKYFRFKEAFRCFGGEGVNLSVKGYAYALLTVGHTKASAEFDFFRKIVLCDKSLERFNDLS